MTGPDREQADSARALVRAARPPISLQGALVLARIRSRLFDVAVPSPVLGRYVPLESVGSGGGGMVQAAWDPRLRRKVAIKLIRWLGDGDGHRLLHEARALATVRSEHVVEVFDVGTWADGDERGVYLVMELVVGHDLDRWLRVGIRSRAERIAVLRAAGLGLADAHAHGIVHRDVKAANILVGRDGRVRVADFGLATAATSPSGRTRTAVVGTPATMSPEQHAGAAVDARSDQFAFAVTAWEVLVGQRPFAGSDIDELGAAKRAGTIDPTALRLARGLPRRIVDALLRALAPALEQRFADMHALLEAFGPSRGRAAAIGPVVALALATGAVLVWARADEGPTAADATARAPVTHPAAAAALERARELGEDRRFTDALQEIARAQELVRDLPDAREHAQALLRRGTIALQMGDGAAAENDLREAHHRAAAHDDLETGVAAAIHLVLAVSLEPRRIEEARAWGRHAKAGLDRLPGRPRLAAAWDYAAGIAELRAGAPAQAEPLLERAAAGFAALEPPDVRKSAAALEQLAGLRAATGDAEGAVELAREAVSRLERALGANDIELARALDHLGDRLVSARDLVAARDAFERALALRERTLGGEHADVAASLHDLGTLAIHDGRPVDALEPLARAQAIWERTLGPEHPQVGLALDNRGNALQRLGRWSEAEAAHGRALAIASADAEVGTAVAQASLNLGACAMATARPADAAVHHRRAVDALDPPGADGRLLARALLGLGEAEQAGGRPDRARPWLERAADLAETLDPELLAAARAALTKL